MSTVAERRTARPPTRARLCGQLVVVAQAAASGRASITSADLARHAPGAASRIRRELGELGLSGRRGVGYDVDSLLAGLSGRLRAAPRRVALVGAGALGAALAESEVLRAAGVEIHCVFDQSPGRCGQTIGGVEVLPLAHLLPVIRRRGADAGVIATPGWAARRAHDLLSRAGVPLVVNFADVLLDADGAPVHHSLPAAGLILSLARS
jgi:redox-sensing transcriptional repressor